MHACRYGADRSRYMEAGKEPCPTHGTQTQTTTNPLSDVPGFAASLRHPPVPDAREEEAGNGGKVAARALRLQKRREGGDEPSPDTAKVNPLTPFVLLLLLLLTRLTVNSASTVLPRATRA